MITPDIPANYTQMTRQERRIVREEYVRRQGGRCAHCKQPLSKAPADHVRSKQLDMRRFPPGFLDWPVHLHHDHQTGLTIGAVHSYCNAVLWQYHGE
jgi:hypothetical protein